MKIIGIAGTNGSGKDTLGRILADDYGYLFVSVTDLIRAEAKRRGVPTERENLRAIGDEWRRTRGLGVLVDEAIEEYKRQGGDEKFKGLALASLRNPGEVDEVHKLGGQVVWVDADPKLRYERVISRIRGDEDRKSFEQFMQEEKDEMQSTGDETTLRMADVKAKADIFIDNNSNSLEDFRQRVKNELRI